MGLSCVDADACFGVVPPLNVGLGHAMMKLCPKRACDVCSHANQKLAVGARRAGFYVQGGNKSQGVVQELLFPTEGDGGPAPAAAAPILLDGESPFRLPFGQWVFAHAEAQAARAEAPSSRGTLPDLMAGDKEIGDAAPDPGDIFDDDNDDAEIIESLQQRERQQQGRQQQECPQVPASEARDRSRPPTLDQVPTPSRTIGIRCSSFDRGGSGQQLTQDNLQ